MGKDLPPIVDGFQPYAFVAFQLFSCEAISSVVEKAWKRMYNSILEQLLVPEFSPHLEYTVYAVKMQYSASGWTLLKQGKTSDMLLMLLAKYPAETQPPPREQWKRHSKPHEGQPLDELPPYEQLPAYKSAPEGQNSSAYDHKLPNDKKSEI